MWNPFKKKKKLTYSALIDNVHKLNQEFENNNNDKFLQKKNNNDKGK